MEILQYSISQLPPAAQGYPLLNEAEQVLATSRGPRFAAIRSILKAQLARRAQCELSSVNISYNEHGKPQWKGSGQHFNISHSGNILLIALANSPIGIDVERISTRHYAKIAPRFMNDEQLRNFIQRGSQQEEFFACWCACEALIKRAGLTIWQAKEMPIMYEDSRIRTPRGSGVRVRIFSPALGYCAALAYEK